MKARLKTKIEFRPATSMTMNYSELLISELDRENNKILHKSRPS